MRSRTLVVQALCTSVKDPHTWASLLPEACLVCAQGTPVADMLTHSPHFRHIIDCLGKDGADYSLFIS
jgi:hypothetical protein